MAVLNMTVDLDSPSEYAARCGLKIDAEDPHMMYRAPLRRFAELCFDLGGKGTVFAVSRDICGVARDRLRALREQGFEIASHSHEHHFALANMTLGQMVRDVRLTKATFREELGLDVVGFRAPGNALSANLLDELEAQGFAYDASVLPSPSQWLMRLAASCAYRMAERCVVADVGSFKMTLAPTAPYRPGTDPYRPGRKGIVELPTTVATPLCIPVTGTTLITAPAWVRHRMLEGLKKTPVVTVHLHAMDLVDPVEDGLPDVLSRRQPELRMSLKRRQARLASSLQILAAGRTLQTCAETARAIG